MQEQNQIPHLVNLFAEKRQRGASFSEIRSELTAQGVSSEDIRLIINLIDKEELAFETEKSNNRIALSLTIAGSVILIATVLISFFTYYISNGTVYVIWFGGFALLFYGLAKRRSGRSEARRRFNRS